MRITILILAAGQVNYDDGREGYPLCLTEFDGSSLLELIVKNTESIANSSYVFAFADSEVSKFHLDKVAKLLKPNSGVIRVPSGTQGSACTALLAASQQPADDELLIISANELLDLDLSKVIDDFRNKGLDGGMIVFNSIHPRYSYVRLNESNLVTQASQQEPITKNATAGVFWFRKNNDFINAAMSMIRKDAQTGNKFYIAPTYNEIILKQMKVGVYRIDLDKYHPLKNQRQVTNFEQGQLHEN